jgi:hypothetical protein
MSGVNPYLRPSGGITVEEFRASIALTLSGTPLFLDSRTRTVQSPLNQPVLIAANASAYQMVVFVDGANGLFGGDPNLAPSSNSRSTGDYVALLYAGEQLWFVNLSLAATSVVVSEVVP